MCPTTGRRRIAPRCAICESAGQALGGLLPARRAHIESLETPPLTAFGTHLKSSGQREISTTMAFVRMLSSLVKDADLGQRVVPIVPDEARTFGMEGMFRQLGIYSSVGQRYTPVDAGQVMFYKEDIKGQILEEGINEAGAFSAWLAAATSYSTSAYAMVPFYIFYSMFGFQRIGDLAWAAGDSQARGFLIGATAGRTTLNGEGLQHQDGHSHLLAGTIPNCVSYDPAYAYELAVIIQDGLRRMYHEGQNRFLLHHHDERKLCAARNATGRGGGHHPRHVSAEDRHCGGPVAGATAWRGSNPARG